VEKFPVESAVMVDSIVLKMSSEKKGHSVLPQDKCSFKTGKAVDMIGKKNKKTLKWK